MSRPLVVLTVLPLLLVAVAMLLRDRRDPSRWDRTVAPYRNRSAVAVGVAAGVVVGLLGIAARHPLLSVTFNVIFVAALVTAIADVVMRRIQERRGPS
jgi:uncharacterized membrane protein YfcA